MAEANAQGQNSPQGANGQAQQNGAANGQPQGAQGQAQDPAWFQHIPEQYREEAKKSYLLHSDYTKKTQELAEQRKSWEAEQSKYKDYETKLNGYEKWWNENKTVFDAIQKNWDKVAPILNGQAVTQNQQTQSQQDNGQSNFDDWDVLPPREQAKRLADYVNSQYMTQALAAQEQKFAQILAQKEQGFMNYLAVLTDAFERKAQDPSLKIPEFIQKANEYSYGKFNPMELAYQSLTGPQSLEKMKEEWLAKGREEGKLEAQNQQQSTGAFNNAGPTSFKATPKTSSQVRDAVRELSIQKGWGWGS